MRRGSKLTDQEGFFKREFVEERLTMWLDAEAAIATGQSYKIGSRELKRADLREIRKQIEFWEDKLNQVEGTGWSRTWRAVPRDL